MTTGTLPKIADHNGTILAGNRSIRDVRENGEAPPNGLQPHPAPQRKAAAAPVFKSASEDYSQALTEPALTPWQASALEIQPASMTTFRLSLVMASGVRKMDCIFTFFGPPSKVC